MPPNKGTNPEGTGCLGECFLQEQVQRQLTTRRVVDRMKVVQNRQGIGLGTAVPVLSAVLLNCSKDAYSAAQLLLKRALPLLPSPPTATHVQGMGRW